MKIVATLFFEGDPDALMGPEWEARVEGFDDDLAPYGLGSTAERAIVDLKESFCPCDCQPDAACMAAEECRRTWEESLADERDGCEPSKASHK